jgi:HSP20 family protein
VGKFARDLALPVPIEAEQINATYKDGVLAVLLPKSEDAKPHKVEVKIA